MSQEQINNLMQYPGNAFVFSKLVKYSCIMVVFPLAVMFAFIYIILPLLGVEDKGKIYSIAGIAAVVAVNMVIAAYVIGAFRENLDVDEDLKEKKD